MDTAEAAIERETPPQAGQTRASTDLFQEPAAAGNDQAGAIPDIAYPLEASTPSSGTALNGHPDSQNPDAEARDPVSDSQNPDIEAGAAPIHSHNPDTAPAGDAAVELAALDDLDAEYIEEGAIAPAPAKLKRTKQTEEAYAYRVRQLWRQTLAAKTTDPQSPPAITPLDVVDYLLVRAQEVKFRTWTLYRSALLWDFGERAAGSPAYQEAHAKLAATRGGQMRGTKPERIRASAKARAGIPEADLAAILNQLAEMNSSVRWGARTQYWLQAGIATGVRPSEWDRVSWADEDKTWLLAPISKQKVDVPAFNRTKVALAEAPGRGEDATQEMDGPQAEDAPDEEVPAGAPTAARRPSLRAIAVKPEDRLYVDLHLASIHSSGLPLQKYYANCRTVLWRACRKIWKGKRLYCLYSARHQFSANFKAENPLKDVAQAMGHNDEGKRATNDYAPARLAYGRGAERHGHTETGAATHNHAPQGAVDPADDPSASGAGLLG